MKKIIVLLSILLSIGIVGCTSTKEESKKVSINGSTSMEKLLNGLAEQMKQDINITLETQFTGSSAGIEALINKTTDIASSSRPIKEDEKEKGVTENVVAYDGIAVITNYSSKVENITEEQIFKIFSGEITNWKEIGGSDESIVVIGREAGSGTRSAFEELLGLEDKSQYNQEIDSTGAVVAKVGAIQGAIGYVSMDVVNESVNALRIDGVEISKDTIKKGSYPLQRPFVLATIGTIKEQNEAVKSVFDYIYSTEGQTLIEKLGLVGTK